jgi:TPR repeat protein
LVYSTPDTPTTRITHGAQGLETKQIRHGNAVVPYAPAVAVRYLTEAANKQFPVAQTMLAELLVEAPRGVPRDYVRAEKLLTAAVSTGYGRAQLDLLDLNTRRGNLTPEQLAKELMNNSGNFKKYIERWSVPGK